MYGIVKIIFLAFAFLAAGAELVLTIIGVANPNSKKKFDEGNKSLGNHIAEPICNTITNVFKKEGK